jgi:hypothetical protein
MIRMVDDYILIMKQIGMIFTDALLKLGDGVAAIDDFQFWEILFDGFDRSGTNDGIMKNMDCIVVFFFDNVYQQPGMKMAANFGYPLMIPCSVKPGPPDEPVVPDQ